MRALLACSLVLFSGCERAERKGNPQPDALADLGSDGVLFASLGPVEWDKLADFPRQLSRSVPLSAGEIERILTFVRTESGSAWGFLRLAAARLQLGELPASPAGLDPKRPVLLALGTPIALPEEQIAALAASLSDPAARRASGLRHRIILPATDAGALANALAPALAPTDEHFARVTRRGSHVTVDLVIGHGLSLLDEAARARALGPVDRDATGLHPLFAGGEATVARAHIRLDRLGDVGASAGATMIARVQSDVDIPVAPELVMQGIAEVLTAPLAVDPEARLFSDAVIDIPAADPTQAAVYLVATPRGVKTLSVDRGLASGQPTSPGELDLALLSAAAPNIPRQTPGATPSELAEPVHMCGWACSVYYGLGNGLGFLRALEAEEPGFLANEASRTLRLAAPSARLTLAGSVLLVEPMAPAEGALSRARAAKPRDVTSSPALTCYLDAVAALRRALLAVAAQPAEVAAALDHVTASEAKNLTCAAEDPVLAQRAAALRAAVASLRAVRNSTPP